MLITKEEYDGTQSRYFGRNFSDYATGGSWRYHLEKRPR
jgi:hypothetical protein